MSNIFPFERDLYWVQRPPLRKPIKVSRRAMEALHQQQLEEHQDYEHDELTEAFPDIL